MTSTLDMSRAISEGQFHPYFQPLIELRTGKLRGFELLARWIHPEREPYMKRALKGESIPGVEISVPPAGSHGAETILAFYEPARDEAGEVVGVSIAVMDISKLKRMEAAYRESQENFRQMMELSPQIPWVLDAQGRALDVSSRWLEITGMTGDEWKGMGWLNALHPDDRQPTLDALQRGSEAAQPIDTEYRVRRPGQDWRWVRARGAPRLDEDGKIVSWYGCLDELTDKN